MNKPSLEIPSESVAKEKLKRFFSEEEIDSIWNTTLNDLCIENKSPLEIEDLERIFSKLASGEGMVAVFGKSLLIRLKTYQIKLNNNSI